MKPDLRISIKDYRRDKTLRVSLARVPFGPRQFFVRMEGKACPASGQPVSLSRVFAALRKAVVRAVEG